MSNKLSKENMNFLFSIRPSDITREFFEVYLVPTKTKPKTCSSTGRIFFARTQYRYEYGYFSFFNHKLSLDKSLNITTG